MAASVDGVDRVVTVTYLAGENEFYANRQEAEKSLGFSCRYTAADLFRFKMCGYTIVRQDLNNKIQKLK